MEGKDHSSRSRLGPIFIAVFIALLALTLQASPAHAGGVVSICDEANLRQALSGGGTVTFSCSGTIVLTAEIPIEAETTIDGSGQNVTISGNNAVRVFYVKDAVFNLNDLTIANGDTLESGGGIRIDWYSKVAVTNSTFTGNRAGYAGGGIFNDGNGELTVSNSTFTGNNAGDKAISSGKGGGIGNYGKLTVNTSFFKGNTAGDGGGAIANSGTLIVDGSTFSNNDAPSGGGIRQETNHGQVRNSTFDGNSSGYGGGIYSGGSLGVTVINSTFTGNSTYPNGRGGGIYNTNGSLIVINSTIAGNSADSVGGIYNDSTYAGTTALRNTIIANNQGGNCGFDIRDEGGNLSYPDGCVGINGDPMLGPLQNNGGPTQTMAIGSGSTAIDAADDAICASEWVNRTDQRGIRRTQGSHCDIGAYEFEQADVESPFTDGVVRVCDETQLRQAVLSGSTVTFGCSGTITLTAEIEIQADTIIDGSGQNVTISGNNMVGVFDVNGVVLKLNYLTIANGNAISGGGVSNRSGTVTVSNSIFTGNIANKDGGIGGSGGGIDNYNGNVTVSNSTFTGNGAGYQGGGISNSGGTMVVSNSTFVGNSSAGGGGAIAHSGGTLTVINSTFANNTAYKAGGISNSSSGTVTLTNTIVANSGCSGTITDGGGNLSYPDTTCPGINGNPRLGPLQNNGGFALTMAIDPRSAAFDAANDATCAAPPVNNLDQRGMTRPLGSHCDIGAYESQYVLGMESPAVDGIVRECNESQLREALSGGGSVTFRCSGSIILMAEILIQADTTIDGSGQDVTVSGNNAVRVFLVNGVVLDLNNLTIANGKSDYGGGVTNSYGTVTLSNSILINNNADSGGAIANLGMLTVSNSTLTNNTADSGGAIANVGTAIVNNVTFINNQAGSEGGGIYTDGSTTVGNSTFTSNSADSRGGGIYNENGSVTVSNSTFADNTTGYGGGGIYNHGSMMVSNSTFASNSADEGRSIANDGMLTLKNTIVTDTLGGSNCSGTITDGDGNLNYPDTTCPGINEDPKLGPLQDNGGPTQTMALGPRSAALDAANDAICSARPISNSDQRGIARPQGAHCDIGAYESDRSPVAQGTASPVLLLLAGIILLVGIVIVIGIVLVARRGARQARP